MENIIIQISEPHYPVATILTKEDVWGAYIQGNNGMIIGRSQDDCPYFNDEIPYKSVTMRVPHSIIENKQLAEVFYWIEYVMGAGSVSKSDSDDNGDIILRCDYMCW